MRLNLGHSSSPNSSVRFLGVPRGWHCLELPDSWGESSLLQSWGRPPVPSLHDDTVSPTPLELLPLNPSSLLVLNCLPASHWLGCWRYRRATEVHPPAAGAQEHAGASPAHPRAPEPRPSARSEMHWSGHSVHPVLRVPPGPPSCGSCTLAWRQKA